MRCKARLQQYIGHEWQTASQQAGSANQVQFAGRGCGQPGARAAGEVSLAVGGGQSARVGRVLGGLVVQMAAGVAALRRRGTG